MQVGSNPFVSYPNLYDERGQQKRPVLQSGQTVTTPRVSHDLLDISSEGRRRQLDIITNEAHKVSIPSSPKDDVSAMMQRFRPEIYERMTHHLAQGNVKEGLGLLHSFTLDIANHPEWLKAYRSSAHN